MAVRGIPRLTQVDPDLVRLVESVGLVRDIVVLQGARSIADEQADIAAGRSHLQDPTHSLHVIVPGVRDLALAVDVAPWPIDWTNHQAFVDLATFMKARAALLGITPFSWGGDWPHPFDFDHFQKAPAPA